MRNSEHPKAFHLVLAQDNWLPFCSMLPFNNNSKRCQHQLSLLMNEILLRLQQQCAQYPRTVASGSVVTRSSPLVIINQLNQLTANTLTPLPAPAAHHHNKQITLTHATSCAVSVCCSCININT